MAIGLVVRGATQAEVARRLDVTREAVRQWVEAWRAGGPAALAARPRARRRRVDLARISAVLSRARTGHDAPLTTLRVQQVIERRFGVKYCASSARSILHRLGFAYSRLQGWRLAAERRQGEPRRRAS